MIKLIQLGGWMMIPILLCSVMAMAIIGERLWALRTRRIMPEELIPRIWKLYREGRLDANELRQLQGSSPLGLILAAALGSLEQGREAMRESAEQAGRQVVHELEKYLNTLGTIASISPYLGLLGSVLGMIEVFASFSASSENLADPARLAGGLSEILVATAAGLTIAIPSLAFYRYLQGRVTELAMRMEEETLHLIEKITRLDPSST